MSTAPKHDDLVEHLQSKLSELRRLAYLLSSNLNGALDCARGAVDEHDTITLKFQREGVDTAIWLSSEIWVRLAELDDHLIAYQNARCEAKCEAVA